MAVLVEAEHGRIAAEVALQRRRVVAGRVAECLEALAELLGEERRDDVVAGVLAGEDPAERRAVVRRVRPVLDPPVAPVERIVELGDVADRIDAGPRGLEPLVDDDAAPNLEAGGARELDVRLDADARDDEVGGRGSRSPRA